MPIILTGVGTVRALAVAPIRSPVTGYLQSADFTEGQFVRHGDVLAQIDPRICQARLELVQAQLAREQALLANQETDLGCDEPLLQKGFATEQQVVGERALIVRLQSAREDDEPGRRSASRSATPSSAALSSAGCRRCSRGPSSTSTWRTG